MYVNGGIILAFFIGIFSFWLMWRKRRFSLFQRYGIPGPTPNFWAGNLKEFIEKREKCTVQWTKKYGKFVGFYIGAKPYLMTSDVDLLKLIQVKEHKNFMNKDLLMSDAGIPAKVMLKALPMKNDEEWRSTRNVLSIAFSTGKIKKMSYIMTDAIQIFLKNLKAKEQKTFDIAAEFNKLTFDIICKAAFGIDTNVQSHNTNKFIESIYDIFNADTAQILPLISVCFPEFEPVPMKLRWMFDSMRYFFNLTSVRTIIETCEEIIESRKKSEHPPSDLLQSMIDTNVTESDTDASEDANNSSKSFIMSTSELIGNAIVFMAAGYDTTSTTLSYCTYLLARNPEKQEKARNEILKNFPIGEEIDYTGLNNLQYLEQVISETLRLHPLTLITINRICAENFQYKDMTIPKGVRVAVPLWSLHRDPAYWTEPDKFIPERFSPENRGKIDPFVYQPFGAGPRICIGMRLATTVLKLTAANILRNYRLEIDQNEKLEMEHSFFFIKPKNGIRIRVIPLI